jgi:hypothetical protein
VINEHAKWATSSMPFSITPIEDHIKKGIVYCYKRDRGFRPIIIINCERLLESKVMTFEISYQAFRLIWKP